MEKITCNNCGKENATTSKYCNNCGYELPKPVAIEEVKETAQKKSKTKTATLIGIFVCLVLFILGGLGVKQLYNSSMALNAKLMIVAEEVNKACPVVVDKETRLDNAVALPENTFQYNYTLVNVEKSDIDTVGFKATMDPLILNQLKTNPQMKFFRDNKVTMNYLYKDKNGVFVSLISVSPDEYE
jgi:hypothetical protein